VHGKTLSCLSKRQYSGHSSLKAIDEVPEEKSKEPAGCRRYEIPTQRAYRFPAAVRFLIRYTERK
jgi:hypothetical protein